MNGFANAILSVLLGWLRSLMNAFLRFFSSEGAGSFFTFFQNNWKIIFVVLCVGGFVVDRLIYLIRWRPYYIWLSKRDAKRRGRREPDDFAERASSSAYSAPEAYEPPPQPTAVFAPPAAPNPYAPPAAPSPYAPPAQVAAYQPPYQAPAPFAPQAQPAAASEAMVYTPEQSFAPTAMYHPIPAPAPELSPLEPRFDEDVSPWEIHGGETVSPLQDNPALGVQSSFGAARPEPVQYLRDVQAGYAPPPAPNQLYAAAPAPAPTVAVPPAAAPVHPGLDLETFQQNIGLNTQSLEDEADDPAVSFPDFTPYSASDTAKTPLAKPKGLGALAKRARDLVGMDEDHQPTIHDLQSTVDVRSSFHAPVYPKNTNDSEES